MYPNLCASCQNSSLCSNNDEFYGDDGALKCLLNNYGHVAFTSHASVQRLLASSRLDPSFVANFEYLCLDGSRVPLDQSPCEWAHQPTSVFATSVSRRSSKDIYLSLLQRIFLHFAPYKPSWWQMRSLLSSPSSVTQLLPVPRHLQHWDKYLGNYISSIEKPLPGCEPNNVTMCVSSLAEELKCLDLQKAAFSLRVRPELECRRQQSALDCVRLVASKRADMVSVHLSELYEVGPDIVRQLAPVALAQRARPDFALAVVRADSSVRFLYQLSGLRSCHGALNSLSGWLAPLGALSERALLEPRACNKAELMADYFGGSCAPGAADLRVNHFRSGFERLCAQCRGEPSADGAHACERSSSERYFGEAGAIRCLVEGAGDVAFVSASSLLANTDGRSKLEWARGMPLAMQLRNFRLVCRAGPAMQVADAELCNLAALPGRLTVATRFASARDQLVMRKLLVQLVDEFGSNLSPLSAVSGSQAQVQHSRDTSAPATFDLFSNYMNSSDLIFDDHTHKLTPLPLNSADFDTLTRQHFDSALRQLPPLAHSQVNCRLTVSAAPALMPPALLHLFALLALSAAAWSVAARP